MTQCPACLEPFAEDATFALAGHFTERAAASDSAHVRWLNRNVGHRKLDTPELATILAQYFELGAGGLAAWIKARFIAKFYGDPPHPFVAALQHPSRATLLGYVYEHQHFLRQWVRTCSFIMARTDIPAVVLYELDNLNTEFGGFGEDRPSHYELLLRMGESLGADRRTVLATPPLPATEHAIAGWNRMAIQEPWQSVLAATHSLELIANRNLVADGASTRYFDPAILEGEEVSEATKAFLREGYEADIGHSEEALHLLDEHTRGAGAIEAAQAAFLRSIELFDDYLLARLERGYQFED
jgi:pyrroloquinoline-quinone synthase